MLDVSQNLLDKFHRFRCGHPPINAHHYGWPIVDLARGDVPAFHVRTENLKYARIRTLQDADVFLETERKDYGMSGPEERRRAVELYFTTPMTTAQVVRHLGYPTRQCLERWLAKDPRYAGHMAKPIIPLETRAKAIELVLDGMRGSRPPNGSA